MNNVLQPSTAHQNCADTSSAAFADSLCNALLHASHNDNTVRQQAEQYVQDAGKQQGCLRLMLQLATNQQVRDQSTAIVQPSWI